MEETVGSGEREGVRVLRGVFKKQIYTLLFYKPYIIQCEISTGLFSSVLKIF